MDIELQEYPLGLRLICAMLIGSLSIFFTEVFAGLSVIWYIDLWALYFLFLLYLGHLLFFLFLAIKTKRTSVPQLYLWGVLFSLYEAWITKVYWAGYPGSEGPGLGTFLGIAFYEFFMMVFIWHPIFAFVLPILVFESLALSKNSGDDLVQIIFPSHLPSLMKNRKNLSILLLIMLIGAGFSTANNGYKIIFAIFSILGSIGVIFLLYFIIGKKNPSNFSIHSIQLGKIEFCLVAIYVVSLNAILFVFLFPEKIPVSIWPIVIIIFFYVFIGLMLRLSKPVDEKEWNKPEIQENVILSKDIFILFGILFLLTIIFCLMPLVGLVITFILVIGLFFMALFFFITMLRKALKGGSFLKKINIL